MTMHLAKGLTTTRTAKPKSTLSATDEQLRKDHKEYNAKMRRQYMHECQMSYEDYYKMRQNKLKQQLSTNGNYKFEQTGYRRETKSIPSLSNGIGNASRPASKQYSGSLVKGVMVSHKSNIVPVIDNQHIIDIARMRR